MLPLNVRHPVHDLVTPSAYSLFLLVQVYEEVSEAPTNHKNHSDRSPAILSHTATENQRDDNQDEGMF